MPLSWWIFSVISDPTLHGEAECETLLWDGLHRLPTRYASTSRIFRNRYLELVFFGVFQTSSNHKDDKTRPKEIHNSWTSFCRAQNALQLFERYLQWKPPSCWDSMIKLLNTQVCFVMIESLSHTTDDLIFKWNFTNPLYVSPEIQLPQVKYSKYYKRSQTG